MDVKPRGRATGAPVSSLGVASEDWPARTRQLVEDIYDLASNWLRAPLQRTMEDTISRLYQQAENELSGARMQDHLRVRDKLLANRHQVEQRFLEAVGQTLGKLGTLSTNPRVSALDQPLGLVVPAEQELESTLQLICARGEARGSTTLVELGYRFAVLIGAPPLEGAALPLGPHALTMAFEGAASQLQLPNEDHIALLHSFDRILVSDIHSLCEQVNRYLLADGILPHLRAYMNRMPSPHPATQATPTPESEPTEEFEPLVEQGTEPGFTPAPAANAPIAVLDQLRELLTQRRTQGMAGSYGNAAQGKVASNQELQSALAALQEHVSQMAENTSRELRSAHALREELLDQLNSGRAPGSPKAQLSRDDDDMVELVSMLFEELGGQVHEHGQARSMLGGMQLPMLRMAVEDKHFLEQREHPARRLLNTVAETARDWLDNMEGGPDPIIQGRLEQLIKRANHEPPSSGLYTALLADIEQSLQELKLRARVAERRQVEAVRARERLDKARERASALIHERVAKAAPKGLLKVLLERAWTDVLTLTLLRHGEADPACRQCLHVTDQLLGLAKTSDHAKLKEEVEAGLYRIGMAEDEATQVAGRLLEHGSQTPQKSANAPSNTELVVRLKHRQRLGDRQPAPTPKPAAVPKPPAAAQKQAAPAPVTPAHPVTHAKTTAAQPAQKPAAPVQTTHRQQQPVAPGTPAQVPAVAPVASLTSPREKEIRTRLRKLPFGTWFEFRNPVDGHISQRKLAWFSPMSGRALFVTRRGQRAGEIDLNALAQQIAQGQVREMPATKEHMFDRAWRNLAGNLHSTRQNSHADDHGKQADA